MITKTLKRFVILASFLFASTVVFGQQAEEKQQIERAILNYVEAFYDADTTKAYESIARDLAKRGYYTSKEGDIKEAKMSFEQLVHFS